MTARNTRVHTDAVIPIGNLTLETDNGAVTLTIPDGASGITFQNLGTGGSYASFTGTMAAGGLGFKFGTARETVWFGTQIDYVYLWLHDDDTIVYQWLAPVAY